MAGLKEWEAQLERAIDLGDLLDKAFSLSWNVDGSDDIRDLIGQAVERMDLVAGRIALTTGRLRRKGESNG